LHVAVRLAHIDGAGNDRATRLIRAEFVGPFDRQQFGKPDPRAIDAAFDRADGAAANISSLFVREARSGDKD
jgi:hypothetical protein